MSSKVDSIIRELTQQLANIDSERARISAAISALSVLSSDGPVRHRNRSYVGDEARRRIVTAMNAAAYGTRAKEADRLSEIEGFPSIRIQTNWRKWASRLGVAIVPAPTEVPMSSSAVVQ